MQNLMRRIVILTLFSGLSAVLLGGCGGSSDSAPPPRYQVDLTNLTANQPLAPAAAILHRDGYAAWQLGQSAGSGLERLAEGGDPEALLAEANTDAATTASAAGSGVIMPGAIDTVELSSPSGNIRLTIASMLVNTNDAFTGIAAVDLSGLAVGESQSWELSTYDAGTEDNSEAAGTIPGPAGGGQGYSIVRDDRDYVAIHPGVVTSDDGLAGSALNESHRFLNPTARLVVTRID